MFKNQLDFCQQFLIYRNITTPSEHFWAIPQAKKSLHKVHSLEMTTVVCQSISTGTY